MLRILFTLLILIIFQGCKSDLKTNNIIMESFELPYFGNIALKPAKDYETEINISELSIIADLNFYEDTVDPKTLKIVESRLNDLPKYLEQNKTILISNFNKGGVVLDYIKHHLDVLEKNELELLLGNQKENLNKGLFEKLKLLRIGFYPDENKYHTIFEYSIGEDLTDYRISIRYKINGNFDSIEFIS